MNFTFSEILQYGELSKLSYASNNTVLEKFPQAIIKEVAGLKLKTVIIPDHASKIYWIACRGTANMTNAIEDLKYKKIIPKQLGVPVHEGFYQSAFEVYNSILESIPNNTYKLRLTGHSLGGAIAVILMMLLANTRKIDRIITFGQPKCVTKKGVDKYRNFPLLRVVDDEDPVPLLPPFTLYSLLNSWPYRHFGHELILGDDESYEFLDESKAESIWTSSFWLHLGREEVKEHYIEDYLSNIKSKLETQPQDRRNK